MTNIIKFIGNKLVEKGAPNKLPKTTSILSPIVSAAGSGSAAPPGDKAQSPQLQISQQKQSAIYKK